MSSQTSGQPYIFEPHHGIVAAQCDLISMDDIQSQLLLKRVINVKAIVTLLKLESIYIICLICSTISIIPFA